MVAMRMRRIDPPQWALWPVPSSTGFTPEEYATVQRYHGEMLNAVHQEVEAYVNDPRLVFDGQDEDNFPHRRRLTGSYYIGEEVYIAHRDPTWFQIGVLCRCLERPKSLLDREDDYLGLEVWLRCVPDNWGAFEVFRNTDSSAL